MNFLIDAFYYTLLNDKNSYHLTTGIIFLMSTWLFKTYLSTSAFSFRVIINSEVPNY